MLVTILGAGDMGTAIAAPIARKGHRVHLWGTQFDDHVVAALRAGQVHPRLQYPIPPEVQIFASNKLAQALDGANLLVIAVSSTAIDLILERVLPLMPQPPVIVSLAKGLYPAENGSVRLISERIEDLAQCPVVVVGGPAKANEVVMNLPTISVFASTDESAIVLSIDAFQTPMYRVQATSDRIGVEVGAALKNAYAIAVGVATGMELRTGFPHQNFKAALFPAAVLEMARLAEAVGGERVSVYGLSGAGDLTVTVSAGRNRLLGEMLGRGQSVAEALGTLAATGMTIEGYAAVEHGMRLAHQVAGDDAAARFPVLTALHRILYEDGPVFDGLWDAIAIDGGNH